MRKKVGGHFKGMGTYKVEYGTCNMYIYVRGQIVGTLAGLNWALKVSQVNLKTTDYFSNVIVPVILDPNLRT